MPSLRTTSQQQEKILEKAFSSTPQVKITRLETGGQSRKFGEKFDEEDDWLQKLSFQAQNTTNKPIIFLQVNLNFPETISSGPMMSYPLLFGLKPNSSMTAKRDPLRLMPEEVLDVRVEKDYDRIKEFVDRRHPGGMNKAQLEIGFIVFEDQTAWTAGMFYKPDPADPRRYINVGDKPEN